MALRVSYPTWQEAVRAIVIYLLNLFQSNNKWTGTQTFTKGGRFGDYDSGNYAEIESDGSLEFHGDATVFDDLLGQLIGQRLESPSSDIIQNNAEGSLTYKTTATTADYVIVVVQMSHSWKIGTEIFPHLHWWQTSATMPNWLLQYRWQDQGAAKTTSWTPLAYNDNAFVYSSGTLNQITEFGGITPPANAGLSDIIQFRIIRDTTNASTLFGGVDGLSASVDAVSFDIHYEKDTIGSREEYIK